MFVFLTLLINFLLIEAERSSYHKFVNIRDIKNPLVYCLGSILTDDTILTSAHCLENREPSSNLVHHLTKKDVTWKVDKIKIHPFYDRRTLNGDLALLKIVGNFHSVEKVVLSNFSTLNPVLYHQDCRAYSWSIRDPHNNTKSLLKEFPLELIQMCECVEIFKEFKGDVTAEGKICGYYDHDRKECHFNPGGPVFCTEKSNKIPQRRKPQNEEYETGAKELEKSDFVEKNGTLGDPVNLLRFKRDAAEEILVGVISWEQGCSQLPSLFTRVDHYHDWIRKTVKEMCNCEDEICQKNYEPYERTVAKGAKSVSSVFCVIFTIYSFVLVSSFV